MEFLILDHCVKGRFCAQFGQKSLAPSSFDDRFKMHSICFAPFWLLLPFSTAHQMIRTFFFHSLRLGFWQTNYCNVNLKKWDIQIFLILKFSDLRTQYRTHILVWKYKPKAIILSEEKLVKIYCCVLLSLVTLLCYSNMQ